MSGEFASSVAKFGGTSMARPDVVLEQLGAPENDSRVVVVSAPGKDEVFPTKTTDMLLGVESGEFSAGDIQQRFDHMLRATGASGDESSQQIVASIPDDLASWSHRGDPIAALGEHWSARLFAIRSDREFVDATDLMIFKRDGHLNEELSYDVVRTKLSAPGRYVTPGFYGIDSDGRVRTFARGGSDISGAHIAKALGAGAYHNHSDVAGFMTADPRKVPEARLLRQITYREQRELANGGSELLHPEVGKLLFGAGIKTIMKSTFGEIGNSGTEIVPERAWIYEPIVGVTGRDDMIAMTMHEDGLNDLVGGTADIYAALKDAGIPYEHGSTGTDDLMILVADAHRKSFKTLVAGIGLSGREINQNRAGFVHIVGESLSHDGIGRFAVQGKVALAFAENGIESKGGTDVGSSSGMTFFIKPEAVKDAISIAHSALGLAA